MTYDQKVATLLAEFNAGAGAVGLNKKTSNLFRERFEGKKKRLNVRHFNQVLDVDIPNNTMTVEGMITFEDLTNAALEHGLLPLVVPELKSITLGGAVSGMAIESSSFRYGLVHETVLEMDVLTGEGKVVTATPTNTYKDLFFGLPNSYGTLGYILKLKIKVRPAPSFVRLQHIKFTNTKDYFVQLEKLSQSKQFESKNITFLDGTVFNEKEMYLTLGFDADTAPYTSDYTYMKQYYKSIQTRSEDYVTTYDYIWRWDTDWFWCSKNVFADKPLVRRALGRSRLGSRTYSKLMNFEQRYGLSERLQKLTRTHRLMEHVIQDVEIPIKNAESFLEKFHNDIGIKPVWVCPTKTPRGPWPYPLYPMKPDTLYVNFGFWDSVPAHGNPQEAHYNKRVEDVVEQLGGMKSLYSSSYYFRPRFDKLYGGKTYATLKQTYDPKGRFKDLYTKTVGRG